MTLCVSPKIAAAVVSQQSFGSDVLEFPVDFGAPETPDINDINVWGDSQMEFKKFEQH